jgi:hypothetical protein
MFDPPAMLPFVADGIQLGYAESSVTAYHQEVSGNPRPQPPVRATLDPQVLLVPIQIIKVLPPPSASFFSGLADISPAARNRLFDYRPAISEFSVSHPGYTFVSEQYAPDTSAQGISLTLTEPDTLWSQCGIQFRAVSCTGTDSPGNERCPDLNMTQPLDFLAPNVECHITPQQRVRLDGVPCGCEGVVHRHTYDDAKTLPGVRSDLPIVFLTGTVVDGSCGVQTSPIDKADTGVAYIATHDQSQPLVLAHELGHVLGIGTHDASQPNLMNPVVSQMTNLITPAQCTTARAMAAQYVQKKWGVTVNPGQWTPTPPFKR